MVNQNELYQPDDGYLVQIIKKTSLLFKEFTLFQNLKSLAAAISTIQQGIEYTRANVKLSVSDENKQIDVQEINNNNLAFCLRRYASIIIRDEADLNRYQKAKEALEESLKLYKSAIHNKEVIEIQRSLHQMRKVAYELKDGMLLKESVTELLEYVKDKNNNLTIDCYDSLFHIAFAEGDYNNALKYISQGLSLYKVWAENIGKNPNIFWSSADSINVFTYYRHQAKIELAKLESLSATLDKEEQKKVFTEIETTFWKAYDAHKNFKSCALKKEDQNIADQKLFKDLVFLFSLRCKKTLLELDKGFKPKDYVLVQAQKVFGRNNFRFLNLVKILNEKISFIKEKNCLPLDYKIFELYEPPMISIPAEKIKILFPEKIDEDIKRSPNYV